MVSAKWCSIQQGMISIIKHSPLFLSVAEFTNLNEQCVARQAIFAHSRIGVFTSSRVGITKNIRGTCKVCQLMVISR